MEFMAQNYGKSYKPNTRETVRRQTVHQFLNAALIITNPDAPERPINSPKTVYQIEESILELLRTYGTPEFLFHAKAQRREEERQGLYSEKMKSMSSNPA
jgi:adenine-specific DNA-methyltransferase